MLHVQSFTFNPFQENTYILHDQEGNCAIIDPGMCDRSEEQVLMDFISDHRLKPVLLLNTHCHIDHILGNAWCMKRYNLQLHLHRKELPILERGEQSAMMFGVNYSPAPNNHVYIEKGQTIAAGNISLEVLIVPGHSPGHVAFYCSLEKMVIGGDVLFRGSVGRVDLPGADPGTLVRSIQEVMYKLPDEVTVYPGHGPATTIGEEKRTNYFVGEAYQHLVS